MRKRPNVTQLVDFAKCEKLAVLKLSQRETLDAGRRDAINRGTAAHSRMEKAATVDGRCFVASFAFGADAEQTQFLREFRDSRLLPHTLGRAAVRLYYALSPGAVSFLSQVPGGRRLACIVVKWGIFAITLKQGRAKKIK